MDRRGFLGSGIAAVLPAWAAARWPAASVARTEAQPVRALRFGYAALTWRGDDRAAIDDIATLGYRGIQLRTSAVATWGERPEALKELLAGRGLTLVALSSGVLLVDPTAEAENLAMHTRERGVSAGGGRAVPAGAG